MTHLSIFEPSTLLGQEFRRMLDQTELEFDTVTALATDEDDVDNLIDIAGSPVRVELFDPEALGRVDILISASHSFAQTATVLRTDAVLREGENATTVIVMAPDAPADAGKTMVEGVNLEAAPAPVMLSPAASVVLIAQLARGLSELPLSSVTATALQPASTSGQEAMNEVFAQARSLLTFDGKMPTDVLDRQIAFSTALAPINGDQERQRQLSALLGDSNHISLQTLRASAFHGVGISAALRFDQPFATDRLRSALSGLGPQWTVEDPDNCESTIDRADTEIASIEVRHSDQDDHAWVWIAADNLIRGSARNAVSIVEAWTVARAS